MKIQWAIIKLSLFAIIISSCSKNNIEEIPTPTITIPSKTVNSFTTPTIKTTFGTSTKSECQNEDLLQNIAGLMLYVKGGESNNSDIYLLNMETGEEFRITEDPAIDSMPSISSDGHKVVFTSNRKGDLLFGLYIIDISELHSGVIEETINPPIEIVSPNSNYQIYWPTWSPIGNWIAYSTRRGLNSYIDILNYDTMEWWRINTKENWNHYAIWAPDKNQLYMVNSDDGGLSFGSIIQQIDIDNIINNKQPIQIYKGENIVIQDRININTKSEILLTQYNDEKIKIFKIISGEENVARIMFGKKDENDYQPLWSNDNNWIAYISRTNNSRSIHVYNINNGDDYKVYTTTTMVNINVVWSRNSKYLAYIRKAEKEKYFLEVVSVESLEKSKFGCEIVNRTYGPIKTWEFSISTWVDNALD